EALIEWFHQQGLVVTLNDHPADGVGPHEEMYSEFMQALGEDPRSGKTTAFDAGNKRYMDTMFAYAHGARERDGIDFWWLDWQQSYYTRSIPDLPNRAWLNHYYSLQSRKNGKRPISFGRWGGLGDHRNPIHFSGDAYTTFKMLNFEVPMTATAGNVGLFYWSHDIGGHQGGRNEESYTRWMQFGATTAALRSHSTRDASMDRRPWTYSYPAKMSMKKASELRSKLFPYIYTAAAIAHHQSVPLNRPMYIIHPELDEAYANPQQYYFGDHILVAPITSPGHGRNKLAHQTVWFPPGTWYNYFTGERFNGSRTQVASAELDEFPIFIRAGVVLPEQPFQSRMSSAKLEKLILRAYPGAMGKKQYSSLYEDDGISLEYQSGASFQTEFSYYRSQESIEIGVFPGLGQYNGKVTTRSYFIELPEISPREQAQAILIASDGSQQRLTPTYDTSLRILKIAIPPQAIESAFRVIITGVQEVNPTVAQKLARERRLLGLLQKDYRPGKSIQDYIADLSAEEEEGVISELAALDNIGATVRSRGIYLFPDKQDLLQIFGGNAPDSRVQYKVEDIIFNTASPVTQGECTSMESICSIPITESTNPIGQLRKRIVTLSSSNLIWKKSLEEVPSLLTMWSVVGPFPFDPSYGASKQAYGPEKSGVDLNRRYPDGATGVVGWQPFHENDNGIFDLCSKFPMENRIAYAVTFLNSSQDQEVTFEVNSDDQVMLFLDGEVIHINDVWRGVNTDPDLVKVKLTKGAHTLLIKVANGWGGFAYKVGVQATAAIFQSQSPL
ncbi:MAG: DUF5110 domain-containing protein, partial [Oligoflexia bacterium]|nr:DUF5110 domain-containing protein [Oligoflexia bacterium]